MRRATLEMLVALGLAALCIGGAVEAATFPGASAYLPLVALAVATVLSLTWAAQSLVGRLRDGPTITLDRAELRRLGIIAASTVALGGLIPLLGFFTTFVLAIPATAYALGYRRPHGLAIATVAFVGLLYVVFVLVLERPLPPEIVRSLIGGTP